mmetsp:Transcript_1854/g.6945  ORF Transcript_1854/g.6945 Transcript_1854/m.6945 type:complete len:452 (-) Transcript_1854:1586-2941(-)
MVGYSYLKGFKSHLESEALQGALPKKGRNNPQKCSFGLYAEQISGSAFTEPRASNLKTWLYRIKPSVVIGGLGEFVENSKRAPYVQQAEIVTPERLRWNPLDVEGQPANDKQIDFVAGLRTVAAHGDPSNRDGLQIYVYTCNKPMNMSCMYNSDGDMLIVPQLGSLDIRTEVGLLHVDTGYIVVIPRNIKFAISPVSEHARGYVCEIYGRHFELPERGVIGANGLASEVDFLYPTAAFRDEDVETEVICKFQNRFFVSFVESDPFDVVAWRGNYLPFMYNLENFCPVNSVLFDHMDPSIFTVLTSPSATPGVALLDFVVFPPRWMVQEDTFRPPYFHRNCMTEYMGLIKGTYDAKSGKGFVPGGSSLHSMGSPHGPDVESFEKATSADLKPAKLSSGDVAFMFETSKMLNLTQWALECPERDREYVACWRGFENHFRKRAKSSSGEGTAGD